MEWPWTVFYQRHLQGVNNRRSRYGAPPAGYAAISWMAKAGAGRIAALERCVDLNSGRVCPLARRHFAPTMRVGRGVGITASGQKTPIFVAYRRLERGASRYRSLSLPSSVSSISIACGLEDICCAINLHLLDQRCLSKSSRPLAMSHDRDIK